MNLLQNFRDFVFTISLAINRKKQRIFIGNQRHKNSQETLKTSFLAENKIPPRGVEPPVVKAQKPTKSLNSKESGAKSDARRAPKAPKDPDLDVVVKAWPELPEHIKAAIKALIQTQNKP